MISSVIPLIQVLAKKLYGQLLLATTLKTNIVSKFSDINENFLYTISTFLDPRYKTKFYNEIVKENAEAEIIGLCSW